jgi:outer membrane protein assembly factor BamB
LTPAADATYLGHVLKSEKPVGWGMDRERIDRRTLLKLTGSAGAAVALAGCSSDGPHEGGDDPSDDADGGDDTPTDDGSGTSSDATAASLGGESWAQYQFDSGNTGNALDNAGPAAEPGTRWSAGAGAAARTAPVRANGRVYLGGDDGVLYALAEGDGSELWTYDAESPLRTPAVVDGTVYVTTEDGYVYAVGADGGSQQWEYRVGVDLHPPTVAHGHVYTGGERGVVYALSAADGSESWTYRIGEGLTAPVAATGDRLFAGTVKDEGPGDPTGTVWALTTEGDLPWYYTGLNGAIVAVAATSGPVVAGDKYGNLYGFRSKYKGSADTLWKRQLAGTGHPMPSMAGGTAYVSRGQFVTAVDPADGAEQWRKAPGAMLQSAPAIAGDTAYVGHESGMYAMDVGSGGLAWSLDHGDAMGPPTAANETLAVGSADGKLYVLESA